MKTSIRMKLHTLGRDESGYMLIFSMFVVLVISLIGIALIVIGTNEYNLTSRNRLMDQAYSIAEAGVNRATIEFKTSPAIITSAPTADNIYKTGTNPQWSATEDFSGGSYSVRIWQSNLPGETTDPQQKVIVSTGTIERGDKTAQRTVEVRMSASGITEDYDASFDYLFYNGFNEGTTGDPDGGDGDVWPGTNSVSSNIYFIGDIYMNANVDVNGHYPKGAVYVNGNVSIPVALNGAMVINGNVVATNSAFFCDVLDLGLNPQGNALTVNGNIIAGIEEKGENDVINVGSWKSNNSVLISNVFTTGLTSGITINGDIVAAKDVNVGVVGTTSSGFIKGSAVTVAGEIVAGRDVELDTSINLSLTGGRSLTVGNIASGRKTFLNMGPLGSITVTGGITSGAGLNTDGIGVDVYSIGGGGVFTPALNVAGQIKTTGMFRSRFYLGTGQYNGTIYSGKGKGSNASAGVYYYDFGIDTANFTPTYSIWPLIQSVRYNKTSGGVYTEGTVNLDAGLLWTLFEGFQGNAPNNWHPNQNLTAVMNDVRAALPQGSATALDRANLSAPLRLIEPNWSFFEGRAIADDAMNGWNKKTCPSCGTVVSGESQASFPSKCTSCGTSLASAPFGRAHMVRDRQAGETPEETGDYSAADNDGIIEIRWDSTLTNSVNETIYNGDPNSTIRITKLSWDPSETGSSFSGTIASRGAGTAASGSGGVEIRPSSASNWVVNSNNSLNIVSERNILYTANGISLWKTANEHFHFWAKRNITMNFTSVFTLGGNEVFNGSFTAGNLVELSYPISILPKITYNWSRWPLDAQAWIPPVDITSWKEI